MGRQHELQDAAICMGISGSDDIENPGVSIIEDYFIRECEENRRESGLPVAFNPDTTGRSESEIQLWKNQRDLSELEQQRTNRPEMEYPHDEYDCGIILPKPRVTEVV